MRFQSDFLGRIFSPFEPFSWVTWRFENASLRGEAWLELRRDRMFSLVYSYARMNQFLRDWCITSGAGTFSPLSTSKAQPHALLTWPKVGLRAS